MFVEHRLDLRVVIDPQTRVSPAFSVPACTMTVAVGPRPISIWASMMTPVAGLFGLALSSSTSACSRIISSNVSMPSPRMADTGTVMVSPPQSSGMRFRSCIWVFTRSIFAPLVSILLMATIGSHAGVADVLERFVRLRHEAVVGRDDQDGHIGHIGTAGPHLVEGGMARSVDEGDLLALDLGLVGTDMLGDAAEFAGNHVGLADSVEKGRLSMVDVPENTGDRRSRLEKQALILLLLFRFLLLFGRAAAAASPRWRTSRITPCFSASSTATGSSMLWFIEAKMPISISSEISLKGFRPRARAKSRTTIGGLT